MYLSFQLKTPAYTGQDFHDIILDHLNNFSGSLSFYPGFLYIEFALLIQIYYLSFIFIIVHKEDGRSESDGKDPGPEHSKADSKDTLSTQVDAAHNQSTCIANKDIKVFFFYVDIIANK